MYGWSKHDWKTCCVQNQMQQRMWTFLTTACTFRDAVPCMPRLLLRNHSGNVSVMFKLHTWHLFWVWNASRLPHAPWAWQCESAKTNQDLWMLRNNYAEVVHDVCRIVTNKPGPDVSAQSSANLASKAPEKLVPYSQSCGTAAEPCYDFDKHYWRHGGFHHLGSSLFLAGILDQQND